MNHPTEKLINGEMLDRELLVERHCGLVYNAAKRFLFHGSLLGLDKEDVESLGFIGLLDAFDKFDGDKYTVRFSTFAIPTIQGMIRRGLRSQHADGVKHSRLSKDIAYRVHKEGLRDADVDEIVEKLGITKEQALDAISHMAQKFPISLDKPLLSGEGETSTLADVLDGVEDDTTYLAVQDFIKTLKERERFIVASLLVGHTQRVIGGHLGISQVHVSRTIKKIQAKYLMGEMVR